MRQPDALRERQWETEAEFGEVTACMHAGNLWFGGLKHEIATDKGKADLHDAIEWAFDYMKNKKASTP